MRELTLAVALACALAPPAMALKEPTPGKIDPRMVTAIYNPAEVYAVHIIQGQTLAIMLSPTETAKEAFGSDANLLKATPTGNTIMFWTGDVPVTPRTVFIRSTTADGKDRTYSLLVDTQPAVYGNVSLTFLYPTDEAATKAAQWRWSQNQKEKKATQAALDAASGGLDTNLHYVLQGKNLEDWDLLPTREVSDNGTDTHFHFPGNMRIPIIYAVNPDGRETVIDPTFNSQTGVATVHQLARAFHLRDGDAMLCVFNRAFDNIGIRSETGTVSPHVERVLRGADE